MERSTAESGAALGVVMIKPYRKLQCSKKRDHCDWISALPDEILVSILDQLDTKTAVSTSVLSRRLRHLWTSLHSFDFSEVSLPGNCCWVRLGPMREEYLDANKVSHFLESMRWFTRMVKTEETKTAALRRLSVVFSGSADCTDAVNTAIASAAERGVEEIELALVDYTEYEFPSWFFSGGAGASLTSLHLNCCKLSVPVAFRGFASLRRLVLVAMRMSLKEIQVLLRSCESLESLHLMAMCDIRLLRLPKLQELVLSWTTPCGAFKVDTPALRRLEYCGEILPAPTFQSLPCLEHVSLQYVCSDHPAGKLGTISTRFPRIKSLHLRYQVPKFVRPGTPAVFSQLRALTLTISTKPSDNHFWMVMFAAAAPRLTTLQTNVRYLSCLESYDGVLWDDTEFRHQNLKELEMYNFKGRDNEVGFAKLLLRRAPNMRRVAFSQAPLREAVDRQLVHPDWPGAQEFSPRDNQDVLSKLEGVSSGARVLFM